MPEVTLPSRIDRIAVGLIAALLLFIPLAHSRTVADPFSLPREVILLAVALCLVALALVSHLSAEHASRLRSPAIWLAGLVIAGAALATTVSANRGLAFQGLIKIGSLALVFWGVTRFVKEIRTVSLLFRCATISATLVAVGILLQVFVPEIDLSIGGLSILPPSQAGSTMGDAGLAAQILLPALVLAIGTATLSHGAWRMLWGGCLGLMLAALLFVGRPEGWRVVGWCFAILLLTRVLRAFRAGGGWTDLAPDLGGDSLRSAMVAVIVLVSVVALSRFPAFSSPSYRVSPLGGIALLSPTSGDPVEDRAAAVQGTLALIGRHPLGVGVANWRHAFLEVAWSEVEESPFTMSHQAIHAGNSLVEMVAETGLLGGAAFVLLLLTILLQAARSGLSAPGAWGAIGYTLLNLQATLVVIAFLGSPFQNPAPFLLFWVGAGLTQVAALGSEPGTSLLRYLAPRERPVLPRPLRRRAPAWVILLVWGAAAIAAAFWVAERWSASRYTLIGQGAHDSGEYRIAVAALEKPAARRSPSHLPHALAGSAYLHLGLDEMAAGRFGAIIERSPYFIGAFIGRAQAYQSMGLYQRAQEDLESALAIWPKNTETLMALGRLNKRRGLTDEALKNFREVVDLDPQSAEAFYHIGEIRMARGELDEALIAFRTCRLRDPNYPGTLMQLGDIFFEKGHLSMAATHYEGAADKDPTAPEPLLKMANTYYALSRFCRAKEALEAARNLELDPERRDVILDLIDKVEPRCELERGG